MHYKLGQLVMLLLLPGIVLGLPEPLYDFGSVGVKGCHYWVEMDQYAVISGPSDIMVYGNGSDLQGMRYYMKVKDPMFDCFGEKIPVYTFFGTTIDEGTRAELRHKMGAPDDPFLVELASYFLQLQCDNRKTDECTYIVPYAITLPQTLKIQDESIATIQFVPDAFTSSIYVAAILGMRGDFLFVDIGATSTKAYVSTIFNNDTIVVRSYDINYKVGGIYVTILLEDYIMSSVLHCSSPTRSERQKVFEFAEQMKYRLASEGRKVESILEGFRGKDYHIQITSEFFSYLIDDMCKELVRV